MYTMMDSVLKNDSDLSSDDGDGSGIYDGGGGKKIIVSSDPETELHSNPLDVGNVVENKSKNEVNSKYPTTKSMEDNNKGNEENGNGQAPISGAAPSSALSSDLIKTDLAKQDSFSDVLLSPGVSDVDFKKPKGFFRAFSDPIANERTHLTSSSEHSENGSSSRIMAHPEYGSLINRAQSEDGTNSREDKPNDVEGQPSINSTSNKFRTVASFASLTKWWKKNVDQKITKRKTKEKIEERKMRYKLQYHFMTPFEKYKLGRKPWKLGVQILKILIVTTQVLLFGADRFASVAFIKNTHKAFRYLFIPEYDGNPSFSIYTREQLVNTILHVDGVYHNMTESPIGRYWYQRHPPEPVHLCEFIYKLKNQTYNKIDYQQAPQKVCQDVSQSSNFSRMLSDQNYFNRVVRMTMRFKLVGVYLNAVILGHNPECMNLNASIHIDNSKHDGRLRVRLKIEENLMEGCAGHKYSRKNGPNHTVQDILIAFDVLVISICSVSLVLCLRSVIKSIILAQSAEQYFEEYRHEKLKKWDLVELINKWFPVIALSDLLSITGSIYKIQVDSRDIRYYNITSVFLGVGVILVWVGLLRFFTYFKEYNTLLITLRAAAPSLLRFMFCAMFIFIGFTFCGWIVMGAYHEKYKTFLTSAECLFSLVNGDDMYPTFSTMPTRNVPIWVFSKVYIYVFVSLFIYLILSTFISIVGDAYERLKDYGRMPPTRIERFISGRKKPKRKPQYGPCPRCEREAGLSAGDFSRSVSRAGSGDESTISEDDGTFSSGRLISKRVFTSSQLSLVSASLE